MKILITGAAGFIGFHLVNRLLSQGHQIVGIDNINDYYDVNLKFDRLAEAGVAKANIRYGHAVESELHPGYKFIQLDLNDKVAINALFENENFDAVCNLAAQAGVRYSIDNPDAYIDSNIVGFMNILEGCRNSKVDNLVYASSSSVYGLNRSYPFSTDDSVDHPISLYAASKKSNELMAHTYSHLFGIRTTGLRFFTVYGPWGRPDMALFKFVKAAMNGQSVDIYNDGEMWRDFTYIDDIVEGIIRVIANPAEPSNEWDAEKPKASRSSAPYRVFNIGNSKPVCLMDFVYAIEKSMGLEIKKNFMAMQPGDVTKTYADVEDLKGEVGYKPDTPLGDGVDRFVQWYKSYYAQTNRM